MELRDLVRASYESLPQARAAHASQRSSVYSDGYNNDGILLSKAYSLSARRKCTCRFLWNYELHGLTSYLRAKTLGERVLWCLIIAVCVFFAATTTQTMFSDYLEHQTATLVTIRQKPEMKLPSITVCPKNPDALDYKKIIRDIGKRLPRIDRFTLGRLLAFVIAGAGFSNVNEVLHQVSPNEMQRLSAMYRRWKGNRSLVEFYTTLIEKNGYRCDEFFSDCYYGFEKLNCCEIFRPYYVMLRGRCFRIDNFTQKDPDASGKLRIYMNQLHSRLSERAGLQPQVIAYVSDKYPDVATFPRFYIDFHLPMYVRIRARRLALLPWNNECTNSPEYKGRACYVLKWLELKVIKPLNCTVYYLRHKIPDYPVCDPETIVKNYKLITDISMAGYSQRCLPQCHRFDHRMRQFRADISDSVGKKPVPAFRLEISYTDLEVERYEEILTTTLPGFVSQLGGQSGLFIGMSACTTYGRRMNSEDDKNIFDHFCDYTSISGFRFLHTRHPFWFRVISAIILFGSIGMFFRHSHVFVHKYISNETRLQLSTIKAESIEIPSIVICPVRQFRSFVFDNSTPDFMYAVTHFYELSNQVPHIHGINLSLSDAVETALEKVHQIANLSSWSEQINRSKEFYEKFSVIFPHVASLMNIHNVLLIVSQPRQRLENFTNFTFWNNQNHECLQKYLSFNNSEQNPNIYEDPRNISLFIGCRINKAIQLLTEFRFEMAQFPQYALTAQKPMNETILWCRWLDGGNCVYKEVPSNIGVKCFSINGESKLNASYITLKSSIKILIETFSMNNQIDNWRDKVVKIFLMPKTDQIKICNGYLSYDLAGGNHLDLNVVHVREDMTKGINKDYISSVITECDNQNPTVTYKIDQGFSRVRLFDDYKMSQEVIKKKSNEIHSMSEKAAEIGNGAYLPTAHKELFKLIDNFYDGHAKLLSLFDRHMSELFEFRLLSMGNANYCTEIPSAAFSTLENQILGLISAHWKSENEKDYRDQLKDRDLPTNIPQMIMNRKGIPPNELIDYSCLDCLSKYLNDIFDVLVSFQNNVLNLSLTDVCEQKLDNISEFTKTHPLMKRLSYDTSKSDFIRTFSCIKSLKSTKSQQGIDMRLGGFLVRNNLASIQFRFRSMTKMEIKESTRYQLFDLLVNLGSTLGLYFGMTVLTLFELAIFVFYRDESKIKMQRVPDQSVIYDLPRNAKKTSQMVHQRKTKNNIQGLYKNEANSIMPTIF